jgi:hypothetical protein
MYATLKNIATCSNGLERLIAVIVVYLSYYLKHLLLSTPLGGENQSIS